MNTISRPSPIDEKETDCYRTPPWLIDGVINRYGMITIDVAASSANAVAPVYYTREDDAIAQSWYSEPTAQDARRSLAWCNPPYSAQSAFVRKAIEENGAGCSSVLLVSSFLSDRWWEKVDRSAAEILFITGRVQFLHPTRDEVMKGNRHGSILIYFDGKGRAARKTMARKHFISIEELKKHDQGYARHRSASL